MAASTARWKGYSALLWFTSGLLGIVILLFFPSAKNPNLSEIERLQKIKVGNIVGAVVSLLSTVFIWWPILQEMLEVANG